MKPAASSLRSPSLESLKAIPYGETIAAEPPIPVTVAPLPSAQSQRSIARQTTISGKGKGLYPHAARSKLHDDVRRDSGLAPSSSTARDSRTTMETDIDSNSSMRHSPSIPSCSVPEERPTSSYPKSPNSEIAQPIEEHHGLPTLAPIPSLSVVTDIPTGSFEDLTIPGNVEFSKRGSMLIGGKKANKVDGETASNGRVIGSRRYPNGSALTPQLVLPKRVLSANDEVLSQKVRSMYEAPDKESGWAANSGDCEAICKSENQTKLKPPSQSKTVPQPALQGSIFDSTPSSNGSNTGQKSVSFVRGEKELAGGIEDWEDLGGGDVDRYGFIVPRRHASQASSVNSRPKSTEPSRNHRISTLLQAASDAPRRQRSTLRKSNKSPARSAEVASVSRPASRINRPTSSQSSYRTINGKESKMRSAANRLPHNKDRRCVDEAGDMLTLPPGLADIAEDEEDSKAVDEVRKREWQREEKWRKMARVVHKNKQGGGTVFDFDTRNPKVIERTWKGIPDRWRATAWHAFLTASARKRKGSASDDDLIAVFKTLVDESSPDDVQIDIDVPRTINSHIMFRRRYRGGQRLLFRVLHCLSIYFPDTGYVQGMAALAATLLCYFDEEMTFVMLVRLWQLRGLERLYQSGFDGLMQALEEFESNWLVNGEVAAKLVGRSCWSFRMVFRLIDSFPAA